MAERRLRDIIDLKSSMISLMSQEFGNVLTSMLLTAHIQHLCEPASPDASRQQSYETLVRTLEHLMISVENVMDLERLGSGKLVMVLRSTDMRKVVMQAMEDLRSMAKAKRLQMSLDCDLPPGEPVAVRADPAALDIIVHNLLSNAIKYTPEEGMVTARISRENGSGPGVWLAVQDTGIGIARQHQPHVRAGFYRTEESRRIARGLGVGLRLSQELLELHGSGLEMESEPGKGTNFHFCLPLCSGEASSPAGAGEA
jgi:signal transduction histidine kinase